jgi:hypothetical protein
MSMCATCEIEARPGSGVCHRCGRPLPETIEAAAAIKPVASPHPSVVNVGAPRSDAATLPSIPVLQGVQPAHHLAEPGPGAASTAGQQAPRPEAIPPPRSSQRRRVGLIMLVLMVAVVLAWVASQVVPGLTREEPVAPAEVKPAALGDSQAMQQGVAPVTSESSPALVSSAGLVAGSVQPETAELLGQLGAPSGRQQVELARHYGAAEAAWGHDDDAVLTELEAVYALDPSYREVVDKLYVALLGLAGRQVGAGDLDGAVATLERAAALAPERAEAQVQLAAMQASTEATGSGGGGQTSQRSDGSGGWRSWYNGSAGPEGVNLPLLR